MDILLIIHLPPLQKGGRGGISHQRQIQIPPNPPLLKGGTRIFAKGDTIKIDKFLSYFIDFFSS